MRQGLVNNPKRVMLSSGEAELEAAVKTSTEILGVLQLMKDWGIELEGNMMVDSAAAIGVVSRRGSGKLRHVKVGMLWIQEKVEEGESTVEKVKGEAKVEAGAKTQAKADAEAKAKGGAKS